MYSNLKQVSHPHKKSQKVCQSHIAKMAAFLILIKKSKVLPNSYMQDGRNISHPHKKSQKYCQTRIGKMAAISHPHKKCQKVCQTPKLL
jgi:hypothetical protein